MNFFQILAATTSDLCSDFSIIFDVIRFVLNVIQFGVPIVLIVLVSIDMFKAMTSSGDSKEKDDTKKKSIRRLVYAIIIFLVPVLIKMILSFIPKIISDADTSEATNFWNCWNSKS